MTTFRLTKTETKNLNIDKNLDIHVQRIGPELAGQYIEGMSKNRNISQRDVESLARAMKQGLWREDAGDPIRLNSDGQMIDGQHRMWAIVESGCEFSFLVIRGIDNSAQMIMDTGRGRRLADQLRIRGEKYPSELASAISLYSGWINERMLMRGGGNKTKIMIPEGISILEQHPELRKSVAIGYGIARAVKGGAGRWASIHCVLSEIDAVDADAFFGQIQTGENLSANSPIMALRRRLADDAITQRKLGIREYTALVFKAWNAYREGRLIQILSWKAGGATPERYPTPI
jgi:hypothetical protein